MSETTAPAPPSTRPLAGDLSYFDFLRTLNGYEEEAIEKAFARDIDSLPFGRQLRALVFVSRLRAGAETIAARRGVMDMTVQQIFNEFPDLRQVGDGEEVEVKDDPAESVPDAASDL